MHDIDIRITKLKIDKVRHLENIVIPIEDEEGKLKHLIITGKNGSGKTSLLDAMSKHLSYLATHANIEETKMLRDQFQGQLEKNIKDGVSENTVQMSRDWAQEYDQQWRDAMQGVELSFAVPKDSLWSHFKKGDFVLAYYKDKRVFDAPAPKHVEKVDLLDSYAMEAEPRSEFVKYLLDMKMTEALAARAQEKERQERAEDIRNWFVHFDGLLHDIFNDFDSKGEKNVKLAFDEETYGFTILEEGKEPFDFNHLSAGFAAVMDIVVDLIMRMEKHTKKSFRFDLPGIVLIDEVETHLHLELQRSIMKFLTTVFPKIQFIVSTHSPFILNSLEDVVIYDLENHTIVNKKPGLTDVPYEGIVEGYFKTDTLSVELRKKFERFKELIVKTKLSDDEKEELIELEMFLEETPDYLAVDVVSEYRRLKLEHSAQALSNG